MRGRTAILVCRISLLLACAAWAYAPATAISQEKKNLRVVFTGLAWNSELPFRVALARGFFRAQGLEIQPIFVRGGPAALGEPELVTLAYDLYAPALSADLSVNMSGLQFMLDEDKGSGLVDAKFALDRVVNEKLLKAAQQELRAEERLK